MGIQEEQNFVNIENLSKSKKEVAMLVENELRKAGITDMGEKGTREALATATKSLHREHGISMRKLAADLGVGKGTVQRLLKA